MSIHKRSIEHRMLHVRAENGFSLGLGNHLTGSSTSASTTPSTQTSSSSTTVSPEDQSTSTDASTSDTHTSTSTSTSASPSLTTQSSSSSTRTSASSTSEAQTSSSTASSTETSTSSTTTQVTTTKATTTAAVTHAIVDNTSSFGSVTRAAPSVSASTIDPSATASSTPSGSLNTGALVGGIAGGLVLAAIIAFIIAFFVRRWRNRARADEFDAAQFRRSAMVLDNTTPARPATIFSFSRAFGPRASVASTADAGVAGKGAWKYQQQDEQSASQFVDNTPVSVAPSQPSRSIQPRQQYTYGEFYNAGATGTQVGAVPAANDMDQQVSAMEGGTYSTEPQMQSSYDAEAYANYYAFSPDVVEYDAGAHETQHKSMPSGSSGYAAGKQNDDAYGGI